MKELLSLLLVILIAKSFLSFLIPPLISHRIDILNNFRQRSIFSYKIVALCVEKNILTAETNNDPLLNFSESELMSMDLSELIELMRKEDAEWLDSILGGIEDSLNSSIIFHESAIPPSTSIKGLQSENTEKSTPGTVDSISDIERKSNNPIETFSNASQEVLSLKNLGYLDSEIVAMKPTVIKMVLQSNVLRPGSVESPLPRQWFKADTNPYLSEAQVPTKRPTVPKPEAKKKSFNIEVDDDDESELDESSGSKARWRRTAAPSESEREEAVTAAVTRNMDRRASKTRFDLSEDSEQEEDDDEDEDEEADTGLSFWPSAEEFKDLLLDESRFRVDVAGDWLAPYVKEESKWRYRLYKNWLQFLDDGFGDTFDVIEEGFEDSKKREISKQNDDNPSKQVGKIRNVREAIAARDDSTDFSRAMPNQKVSNELQAERAVGEVPSWSATPVPLLRADLKKMRTLLDDNAATAATAVTSENIEDITVDTPAGRKGSRAAVYDAYIRKLADSQQRQVEDSNIPLKRKSKRPIKFERKTWFDDDDLRDSRTSPNLRNSIDSIDEFDEEGEEEEEGEIDYINIRNPKRAR